MEILAQEILTIMKADISVTEEEQRFRPDNSEVYRLLGDGSELLKHTTWQPQHTFSEALSKTISWFSKAENLEHYRSKGYQI